MAEIEKGRLAGGPIPNAVVFHDATESIAPLVKLQASRLVRLYAVNAAMAEALAPLVFLEATR
jgi:hypothetical protein